MLRGMRSHFALVAYVTVIVAAIASCSSAGNNTSQGSAGNGGLSQGTASGHSGGAGGKGGIGGTSNGGSSVSTFTTGVGASTGGGPPCAAYKGDCAKQGFQCGLQDDGCGNVLSCGTCGPNQTCGANGLTGLCVTTCTPLTACPSGTDCGTTSDGCGGILTCGAACPTGQTCGGSGTPNVCGTGICTPKTCSDQGFTCGTQSDRCTGTIDCGTCGANQTCGANGMTGQCVTTCTVDTCASLGAGCGPQSDGCGGLLDCGTCGAGQVCQGLPSQCVAGTPCTGLCLQEQTCPGGGTTSVTGSVFAPNGVDVLPGALVYVPNGTLSPFQDGVNTAHCACGDDVSGDPLVSTVTSFDGTFTLGNVPVGANIPLVIQKGRWRRLYTLPNVAACTSTAIPSSGAQQLRMPQVEGEFTPYDNIPLMGFVTGSVDALECVLRKIGIADSQFSNPSGTGRVRFYRGSGGPGARYSQQTPSETVLWGSQAAIDAYDIVYFACQGADYEKTPAQQQIVVDYANAGGRIFATHYSYVWMTNTAENAVWSPTATWNQANEGSFASDPGIGLINTTDPRPTTLALWLQFIGASTNYGQMKINTLRNDFSAVTSPALLWISDKDANIPPPPTPLRYTFDTPWGAAPANQCGRVLYSDFHVEDASTNGTTFPNECTSTEMTPQEKMLEFMIFDLGSCVTPPPVCVATTCSAQNVACGPIGDGCGNILPCGTCPPGEACIAGNCVTTCTPKTACPANVVCGSVSDGCGGIIHCGSCATGTCNAGECTVGSCTPKTTCPQGDDCGKVSDGCSGTIDCGTCTPPQTCGGGGTPNVCGAPPCTPKTCADQHFNCGMATDGCGHVIDCGTCVAPQTCGGGTPPQANVCGGITET